MPLEKANDDGADPIGDLKAQNPERKTVADSVAADDPHKTEKLANSGDAGDKADATERARMAEPADILTWIDDGWTHLSYEQPYQLAVGLVCS